MIQCHSRVGGNPVLQCEAIHYHYLVFKVTRNSASSNLEMPSGLKFNCHPESASRRMKDLNLKPGGIYGAVLPDPFSNSEVKRSRADDSPAHAGAKVGSCPLSKNSPNRRVFCFIYLELFQLLY